MKLILFGILLFCVASSMIYSQDIIFRTEGDFIKCEILEEDSTKVFFKYKDSNGKRTTFIRKDKIHSISYDTLKTEFKPNNIVKTNIVGYFVNSPNLIYERVVNDRFSLFIHGGLGFVESYQGEDAREQYLNEFGGYAANYKIGDFKHTTNHKNFWGIGARYYLRFNDGKSPRGSHFGPSLNFFGVSESYTIHDQIGNERSRAEIERKLTNLNLNFGFQHLLFNLISLEAILSPGIGFLKEKEIRGIREKTFQDKLFIFSLSLNIGIAFGRK